jgi:hypothetical protein
MHREHRSIQNYGDAVVINPNTIQITVSVSAGSTFGINTSLQLTASAGENQSSTVEARRHIDSADRRVIGCAAQAVHVPGQSAPEPGTFGLMLAGLAACVFARRKYFRS